ncbi:MAG: LeuD/DmdB family oxidoreductase small subunit [Candidatus Hodarchaeales archaeon]
MILADIIEGEAKIINVNDIDTDNIFHASLLTIHDPNEIKKHIFGNLMGYENFSEEDHKGEILVVGSNFGKGSTRQQAVTGFLAHGIKIIIGKSFAPIYYTNAINEGLLLIQAPEINKLDIENGEKLKLDIKNSKLIQNSTSETIKVEKVPQPVIDIINAGGLLELGKSLN